MPARGGAKSAPVNLRNFLLTDASSPLSVVAGTLDGSGRAWRAFAEEKSAALEGVFDATEKVRGNAEEPRGFLFCEGPGSILGIRIAAAAIRARLALDAAKGVPARPVLAFRSLHLAAHLLLRAFPQEKNFTVAAESRMNALNLLRVREGVPEDDFEEAKTSETEKFSAGKFFVLPHRRALPAALAANAAPCSVGALLREDPAVFADVPALLRDVGNAPDAVNAAGADAYARWTPERHRAA